MPNSFQIIEGDALEVLRELPAASVDSMVTDPPAGISFMGKTWDHDHGGRDGWVEAFGAIFAESLRVLKPGAHALVWAIPRTSHWTATALEDAGFEIRDVVVHLFGTGFPKSLDVSKAIDKAARRDYVRAAVALGVEIPGNSLHDWTKAEHSPSNAWWEKFKAALPREDWRRIEREVVGRRTTGIGTGAGPTPIMGDVENRDITAPATEAARQWEGYGTSLKPAAEHWILCRKPLIGTVAANVLEHGTGGLNIDGCRVAGSAGSGVWGSSNSTCQDGRTFNASPEGEEYQSEKHVSGRWPANVVLSHDSRCVLVGEKTAGSGERRAAAPGAKPFDTAKGWNTHAMTRDGASAPENYGLETIPAYQCVESCPVRMLDEQSGELSSGERSPEHTKRTPGQNWRMPGGPCAPSRGSASRFFYCSKPSTAERNIGQTDNRHPTVKAAELMAYFCRLVTPPGGTVLDPFAGSGSTGIGALREGFNFVGIEREAESAELARARIKGDAPLFNVEGMKNAAPVPT
ncbi:hypothetical protein LCGC14_1123700 [marine sediment metagenome]|uniref:DNA methylase N-4/N-6 domain-containing protein n=1 Tax=marine sediment metagenome TaxID=412755 RepID=A0A0F9M7Z6_9ZZZZ